ncbi:MAG: hypothetical protein H5U40_13375, partial [Polyangiaceae bacterium]|nr:hypothetical protein [Polyangiaceae bacterium]
MSTLAQAARRAIRRLDVAREARQASDPSSSARVDRVSLEVVAEGRAEIVSVSLRDGRLLCFSSDGREDGPHVIAALRLLAGLEDASATVELGPSDPATAASSAHAHRVASELDDVLTAIARVGIIDADSAPSVIEALGRLSASSGSIAALDPSRWVGRLRAACARRDVDVVARLLDGAARVSADLRNEGTGQARGIFGAWAGHASNGTPMHERRMVEIGREWLTGLVRAEIQRRYLVDLETGSLYREERRRDHSASIGTCPRELAVGLATATPGVQPCALSLLQYEVSPFISDESWRLLEGHAERDIEAITERYRQEQRSFPGLAEPVVLFAPSSILRTPSFALVDERGRALPIARHDDAPAAMLLEAECEGRQPTWVAGRLVDLGGALLLAPVAAAFGAGEATEHLRL